MNPLHVDRSNPLYEDYDFEPTAVAVPTHPSAPRSQFGQRVFASEMQAEPKRRAGVNLLVRGSILAVVMGSLFGLFVKAVIF